MWRGSGARCPEHIRFAALRGALDTRMQRFGAVRLIAAGKQPKRPRPGCHPAPLSRQTPSTAAAAAAASR